MRSQKCKKIVLYFGKKRENIDPFKSFGPKREVYYKLFAEGAARGFEMYVSSGRKFYFGDLKFGNLLKYEAGKFRRHSGIIRADAVYDRSGGLQFPDLEISNKVLNSLNFKKLCADKILTYGLIGEFMPESFEIFSKDGFKKALSNFHEKELVVLKPLDDFGGRGIVVDYPQNIGKRNLIHNKRYKLQRFVETAAGIPGVVVGRHDLRIVIVYGEVVFAHVRTPVRGGYLANVAQGGGIKEIELDKIPQEVLTVVQKVREKIDDKFDKPLYSIDFGVGYEKPYIFELNDLIGFPREDMHGSAEFVRRIISSLAERAKR